MHLLWGRLVAFIRVNSLVSSIFHLPRAPRPPGEAFGLFNPEHRFFFPFSFFFSSPTGNFTASGERRNICRPFRNFEETLRGELSKKIIIHHEWKSQGLIGFDIRFTTYLGRFEASQYRHTWWNFITLDRRVWTRGIVFDRGARSSFQCNNLISYSLAARNDLEKKLVRNRKRMHIKRCRVESEKNLNIESLFRFDNCSSFSFSFFFFFFLRQNTTVDDIAVVVGV